MAPNNKVFLSVNRQAYQRQLYALIPGFVLIIITMIMGIYLIGWSYTSVGRIIGWFILLSMAASVWGIKHALGKYREELGL